jgi:L-Ala-D/L-Glu epimerase / N-acetyl-D-glutamate racemase
MKLAEITLRIVRLPLMRPYVLSYRTYTEFEPIIVEVRDGDGRVGWGEGHISPGSSSETPEGGWAFCREHAQAILGKDTGAAKTTIAAHAGASKVAATALITAIEMLEDHPALRVDREARLPLLTPFNSSAPAEIAAEVAQRLDEGFRTFKIKVGKDADADARRGLDPASIELFEQPCDADDWDANAKVAAVSPVPLMLDEPICSVADIERAGKMRNVGFCKLKLKRFGGLALLEQALAAVRANGMEPVLGDGLGTELSCWMEACVATRTIRNAGEFNGFLKPKLRLFREPLRFVAGELVLGPGSRPTLDASVLAAHEIARERNAVFLNAQR